MWLLSSRTRQLRDLEPGKLLQTNILNAGYSMNFHKTPLRIFVKIHRIFIKSHGCSQKIYRDFHCNSSKRFSQNPWIFTKSPKSGFHENTSEWQKIFFENSCENNNKRVFTKIPAKIVEDFCENPQEFCKNSLQDFQINTQRILTFVTWGWGAVIFWILI